MTKNKQILLDRAAQHQRAGEFPQAEALYRRLVQEDPYQAEAWNQLGILTYRAGKAPAASHCFDRAGLPRPANAGDRSNRARSCRGWGGPTEAEAEFRRGRLNPNQAEAHKNLGQRASRSGTVRGVREDVLPPRRETCGRLFSRPTTTSGTFSAPWGNLKKPRRVAGRALELNPAVPEVHHNLGNILRDLGRLHESAACYRRALELRPDYPEAHNSLAMLLLVTGDY